MRNLNLIVVLMLLSLQPFAQSPKKQLSNHTSIIKLGANTFFETDEFPFYINWEAKVGSRESVQIGVLPRVSKSNDNNTSGIGFSAAFRKYISKNRPGISGLFVSPIIKVGFLKDAYSYTSSYYFGTAPQVYNYSSKTKVSQFGVGFVFGHNWVYKSGFSFEASGGFGYYNTKDRNSTVDSNSGAYYRNDNYSGILPQLQVNFGYAF